MGTHCKAIVAFNGTEGCILDATGAPLVRLYLEGTPFCDYGLSKPPIGLSLWEGDFWALEGTYTPDGPAEPESGWRNESFKPLKFDRLTTQEHYLTPLPFSTLYTPYK